MSNINNEIVVFWAVNFQWCCPLKIKLSISVLSYLAFMFVHIFYKVAGEQVIIQSLKLTCEFVNFNVIIFCFVIVTVYVCWPLFSHTSSNILQNIVGFLHYFDPTKCVLLRMQIVHVDKCLKSLKNKYLWMYLTTLKVKFLMKYEFHYE